MGEEKVLLEASLCFPVRGERILLGKKMKNIGKGCWNGYGGGIEPGETPEQAMIRELWEEAEVAAQPTALEKVAIMSFHNTKTDGRTFVCRVHIYLLRQWEGDFRSTEEMANPTWFDRQTLPLGGMMPADREWVPIILSGRKIIGTARYGPYQQVLLGKVEFQYVESFSDV